MGLNFGRLLDYGLPIGMSFIPGIGPVMAGVISGGITAARTGNLMKGLGSGLMAGGLNAGVGSLAGKAAEGATPELVGGPEFFPQEASPELLAGGPPEPSMPQAGPAAAQTMGDRFNALKNSSGSDVYDAFFPKGGGLLTPGGAAGAGLLGQYSADVKDDRDRAMKKFRENLDAQSQRDRSKAMVPMTPMRPYNYEDPYQVAYQGRKTPFFGNADGGEIKKPPPPKKDESILDRLINGWQSGADSKYPPPPVKQGGGNGKYADGGEVKKKRSRDIAPWVAPENIKRKSLLEERMWQRNPAPGIVNPQPGGSYMIQGSEDWDRMFMNLDRSPAMPMSGLQIAPSMKGSMDDVIYKDNLLPSETDRIIEAMRGTKRMASGGIVTMDQYGMGRWKGPAGGDYVSPYLVGIGGSATPTLALPGNQSGIASSSGSSSSPTVQKVFDVANQVSSQVNPGGPGAPWLPFSGGGEGSDGGPSAAGADAGSAGSGDGSGDYMQGGIVALAGGGFAPMPGSTVPKQHRRSGSSMIRSLYPDRQTAAADSRSPDSPIKQMGVKGPNDPLLRAAFADQAGLGRLINGPGDGRSDSVPAVINGRQPAALSDGEFVIPASAVSAIGKGSSRSGAQKLQRMIDKVHKPKRVALPA